MKTVSLQYIFLFSALVVLGFASCKQPVTAPSLVPVRISIYGTSENPVNLAWTIHGESGTVGNQVLNFDNQSPLTIDRSVLSNNFGPVDLTITDSGATGDPDNLVAFGAANFSIGFQEKEVTLDENTEIPPGSGNFLVKAGDFLRDSAGHDLYIMVDPTLNQIVTVSDESNNFTSGAWELRTSNRSNITVIFEREGNSLHTMTGSTNTQSINMTYGSLFW